MTVSSVQKQPSGDLRVAESAERFQGQGDLVFPGQGGMTAGEDQSKLAVLDLGVEEKVVKYRLARERTKPGPCGCQSQEGLAMPQGVDDLVASNAMHPGRTDCREHRVDRQA